MGTQSFRILMVDDSAADRALFRRYLTRAFDSKAELAEEGSGEAGLRRAELFAPDCIVLDLNLPDMNGLEFLERLRGGGSTSAVVVATGFGSEQVAVSALKAGATDYLVKGSLNADAFRQAIVRAIEKQRLVCQVEQHRRELEASEARFRTLTEAMPQIVWTACAPGCLEYVNRGWRDFTGADATDATGVRWADWLHPEDRPRVSESWREAAASGRLFEIECRLRSAAGAYRWQLMRGVPFEIRGEGGATWLGTLTDIEDQKRAEWQTYQRQKLESIGLLAGGVAHDFNNLLVSILGGVSFALDMLPRNHSARPVLEGAIRASERAADLTRQMLAYAGKGKFVIEPVNVPEVLIATCELVRVSIPKSIQLTIDAARALPPVEGDPSQLQQVAMNLVINAAEAIGEHPGVIAIRTGVELLENVFWSAGGEIRPGRYVVIEVVDTGCGMDEATQAKIFDPFFTTKFTGRGLGLAAVQGIVRGYGGAIGVSSKPGAGTTFRVLLPASSAAVKPTGRPTPKRGSARSAGRVLVADDEELVREMASSVLHSAGYTVAAVGSGREVLQAALRREFALILLDMSMPDMSGEETLRKLRAAGVTCPVVVSSGYSELEMRQRFEGERVSAFLAKPYTMQVLLQTVAGVCPQTATKGNTR